MALVFLFSISTYCDTNLAWFRVQVNTAVETVTGSVGSAQRFSMNNDTLQCYLYRNDYAYIKKYLKDTVASDRFSDVPKIESISLCSSLKQAASNQQKTPLVLIMQFTDNNGNMLQRESIIEAQLPTDAKKPVYVRICKSDAKRPKTAGFGGLPFASKGISSDPHSGMLMLDGNPMMINPPKDTTKKNSSPVSQPVLSAWAPPPPPQIQPVAPGQTTYNGLTKMIPTNPDGTQEQAAPNPPNGFNLTPSQTQTASSNLFGNTPPTSKFYGPNDKPPAPHSFP